MLIKIKNTDIKYLEVFNQKLMQFYKVPFFKVENKNYSVYLPINRFYVNKFEAHKCLFCYYAKDSDQIRIYDKQEKKVFLFSPQEFAQLFNYECLVKQDNKPEPKQKVEYKPKKEVQNDYSVIKNTIENQANINDNSFEAIKKIFGEEGAN